MKGKRRTAAESISHEELTSRFRYDPETGILSGGGCLECGCGFKPVKASLNADGYLIYWIDKKTYPIHRLGWFYVHKTWPDYIDHANMNKADNRLSNLRACDADQNKGNLTRYKNNTTGFKGVFLDRRSGRYFASINNQSARAMAAGEPQRLYLGLYDTPEEAQAAYLKAAKTRWGEFARAE